MTEHNNPPAFPLQSIGPDFAPGWSGMTLLDHFAGLAMQVCMDDSATCENVAKASYEMANAMLKERQKWIK